MIEFKKAIIPDEIAALCEVDRRAFHAYPNDAYGPKRWIILESYWIIADGKTVGCTAFGHHIDYDERPRPGCLYISSTSVLPEFQGQGFGKKQKEWQIEYARKNGFQVVVTNMRQSNARIIALNESYGFQRRNFVPDCFSGPTEAAVVMELDL
jgi:GNAT superfamily N-acetyltransferase